MKFDVEWLLMVFEPEYLAIEWFSNGQIFVVRRRFCEFTA